jgi:hypothetical protein
MDLRRLKTENTFCGLPVKQVAGGRLEKLVTGCRLQVTGWRFETCNLKPGT